MNQRAAVRVNDGSDKYQVIEMKTNTRMHPIK